MTEIQWFDNPKFDTANTSDAWYARRARAERERVQRIASQGLTYSDGTAPN